LQCAILHPVLSRCVLLAYRSCTCNTITFCLSCWLSSAAVSLICPAVSNFLSYFILSSFLLYLFFCSAISCFLSCCIFCSVLLYLLFGPGVHILYWMLFPMFLCCVLHCVMLYPVVCPALFPAVLCQISGVYHLPVWCLRCLLAGSGSPPLFPLFPPNLIPYFPFP
jgi:hypothetical protein